MTRVVTIHQPNYLPYIGFFQKIAQADVYVVLDHVPFSKNSLTARNRIRTREGWKWLTIPIPRKYDAHPIHQVQFAEDTTWWASHLTQIQGNYGKADHFPEYYPFFKSVYTDRRNEFQSLEELNLSLIRYLLDQFGIETEMYLSRDLPLPPGLDKTGLNLGITQAVGGDVYLSGASGKEYLEAERFQESDVELHFFSFTTTPYKQRWPGFEPYMSAIDLLFNLGEESRTFFRPSD